MDVLAKMADIGIVPVVVIERMENAIDTAKALADGGVDILEITLRTAAGLASIRTVADNCPNICVGAGTVTTLDECKSALDAGAKFIVSPGFDKEVILHCAQSNVPVVPGCVTPTEIMEALKVGINVIKFFPSNVYGGLSAMKALSGPFGGVKFVPTGGVSEENLGEYISAPFVHAIGGSWLCDKKDISSGSFSKITKLSQKACEIVLHNRK